MRPGAKASARAVDGRLVQAKHACPAPARRCRRCPSVRERDAGRQPRRGRACRLSATSCRTSRARPAPSADRIANSRLALHAAREQQARDVGAADAQHEDDGAEHQQQRRLTSPIRCSRSGTSDRARRRVGARILLRQRRGDRVHFALRLFARDAGLQPRDDVPPRAPAHALLVAPGRSSASRSRARRAAAAIAERTPPGARRRSSTARRPG